MGFLSWLYEQQMINNTFLIHMLITQVMLLCVSNIISYKVVLSSSFLIGSHFCVWGGEREEMGE